MTREYWDTVWKGFDAVELEPETYRRAADPSHARLLDLVGDVDGLKVLDLGCGNGLLSVYLAKRGALVTAVDDSSTATENTARLAELNRVEPKVTVRRLDAMELDKLGERYDLVVGSFILHHLEPFREFADKLAGVIVKGGRGVFLENNASNPILMFFRNNVVGRFGVPKYGDREEHPFEAAEVAALRARFPAVNVYYPEFMFFGLLGSYIFRGNEVAAKILEGCDRWVYAHLPFFNKYSYRQIIEVFV